MSRTLTHWVLPLSVVAAAIEDTASDGQPHGLLRWVQRYHDWRRG